MQTMTATYDPTDNKLRLYSAKRLDPETYQKVRAAGFIWAPKQDLFVAPLWTPDREDLLLDLCGEIGDEDVTLVDRAENRAERFEEYSDKRRDDARGARESVSRIADNIPLGQPILVGHHSERHARKDAQRIENGMRKAVKMWECADYWKRRADGAIRAAKYKERPDVRARRIKGLEADKRKQERDKASAEKFLNGWRVVLSMEDQEKQHKLALHVANHDRVSLPNGHAWGWSLWGALDSGKCTAKEAAEYVIPRHEAYLPVCQRWIDHYSNRILYEKAMLDEQGASDLLNPPPKTKQLPLCNYRTESITVPNRYNRGETITYPQIEMTQAEYAKIWKDYKGTRIVDNSHRVRTCMKAHNLYGVFLTDAKVHERPAPIEAKRKDPDYIPVPAYSYTPPQHDPEAEQFLEMREAVKQGVQVSVVPQLFPTPPELAAKLVTMAEIAPGHRVLEPSAGTGNIVRAIHNTEPQAEVLAVEINPTVASTLAKSTGTEGWSGYNFTCADFLQCNGDLGTFDRIIMNPPFANGQDIQHVKHALDFLKPGGRLVAIVANGPRQQDQLKPLGEWVDLPSGTFKDSGTNVNTAILIIDR